LFNFHDAEGKVVHHHQVRESGGTTALLSASGDWLVYSGWGHKIAMISRDGLTRCEFSGNEGFQKLAFVDDHTLVSFQDAEGRKQELTLFRETKDKGWKRLDKDQVEAFRTKIGAFHELHYDSRNRLLVVARYEGLVSLFRVDGQEATWIRDLDLRGRLVSSIAVSRDGQRVLLGCMDTLARVFSLEGALILSLPGHAGIVTEAAFSADDRSILTGEARSGVKIWNPEGQHVLTFKPRAGGLTHACFHSDSQRVLYSSTDGTTRFGWVLPDRIIKEAQAIGKVIPAETWAEYDRQVGR